MNFERELLLSTSRKSWKISSGHGTVRSALYKRHKAVWNGVWERDKYRCYYCLFTSKKFQEIHHLNDDHQDNSKDNLVSICPLCHQCFHLDTISTDGGGKIIWLPEFSQQELNYLCRAIFIANEELRINKENGGAKNEELVDFVKVVGVLERGLLQRSAVVEQHIQQGASEPANFAAALLNMEGDNYDKRADFLKPFKLLSFGDRFSIQIKYWKNETFKSVPVKSWVNLLTSSRG